jgi:hypothetical protein
MTGACNKTKGLMNYFLVGGGGEQCVLESETIETVVLK